ncbi:hypothetical protein JTB14_013873 [Gonioctena quinquepunctata]|nr:hypothetical protein JTB14_013873 [Gonioctena quinquepunctata]
MKILECNNILRRSNFGWNGSQITSTGRWYPSKTILNLFKNNLKFSSKAKIICNLEDKRQNTKNQVEKNRTSPQLHRQPHLQANQIIWRKGIAEANPEKIT